MYKVRKDNERSENSKEKFIHTIIREIEMYALNISVKSQTYNSIYFGGGTPTELTPEQLGRILATIKKYFKLTEDVEITLEGIAGQMLKNGNLEKYMSVGFNRISFGVETLDVMVRKRIGRQRDDIGDYLKAINYARQINPKIKINIDMMVGLPHQSLTSALNDIKEIIKWQIDSVDLYNYVNLPGSSLYDQQKKMVSDQLLSAEDLLLQRIKINNLLQSSGYNMISGEVFVKSDSEFSMQSGHGWADHSLNYVLALGPASFGILNGLVYRNVGDLNEYTLAIQKGLFPVDASKRMNLSQANKRILLSSILHFKELPSQIILNRKIKKKLHKWISKGLIQQSQSGYELTEQGKLWYNLMQMDILSYFEKLMLLRTVCDIHLLSANINGQRKDTILQEIIRYGLGKNFIFIKKIGLKFIILVFRFFPLFDGRAITFTGDVIEHDIKYFKNKYILSTFYRWTNQVKKILSNR
jgi:oxygen-independent coproporphyrinogen-3 oxidase